MVDVHIGIIVEVYRQRQYMNIVQLWMIKKLCENWIKLHQDDNPSKLVLLFFLRENYKNSDDSKSTIDEQNTEIEFMHKTFYEYLAAIEIIRLMYEYTKSDDYDKN